jgi:hypothetical protein
VNSAQYTVTFQSIWNATDHSSVPADAHWSNLVSIIHNSPNQFLEIGKNASLGIKNLAELGDNTAISNEIQTEIDNENAVDFAIRPFDPNNATSSITFDVNICDTHPYITLISMIAPSPDWFIAVNSLDFTSDTPIDGIGFWKENFEVDVFAYDAGTDNGMNYNSPNSPNTAEAISMISGFPFNGNKIGTLTVVLQGILLNTNENEPIEAVKLHPNPVEGFLHIDNALNVNSISIFNLLGYEIKTFRNSHSTRIQLDLSNLKSGIYLVKLSDNLDNSVIKKIVLK